MAHRRRRSAALVEVLDAVEARAEVIVTRRDWPALKLQPATAEAALARRVHGKPAPG